MWRAQVCKVGQKLDPNQAAILRVFDMKMASFTLQLVAVYDAGAEEYRSLVDAGADDDEGGAEEDGDGPVELNSEDLQFGDDEELEDA